jgi:hypothetical protein
LSNFLSSSGIENTEIYVKRFRFGKTYLVTIKDFTYRNYLSILFI